MKMKGTHFVCPLCLRVGHLLNLDRAFTGLTFWQLLSREPRLSLLPGSYDQLHELGMVDRIIEQREICRAWFARKSYIL